MKRPPDVNEAISSMLWTPYEQSMPTSSDSPSSASSNNSLSEDDQLLEQQRRRLHNRRSNPLPNSLNWWNSSGSQNHYNQQPEHLQHPITTSARYSFPYCGNYLPSSRHFNTTAMPQQQHQLASKPTTIDVDGNLHRPIIDSSALPFQPPPPPMVHSFTDDFYRFQVIKDVLPLTLFFHQMRLLHACMCNNELQPPHTIGPDFPTNYLTFPIHYDSAVSGACVLKMKFVVFLSIFTLGR